MIWGNKICMFCVAVWLLLYTVNCKVLCNVVCGVMLLRCGECPPNSVWGCERRWWHLSPTRAMAPCMHIIHIINITNITNITNTPAQGSVWWYHRITSCWPGTCPAVRSEEQWLPREESLRMFWQLIIDWYKWIDWGLKQAPTQSRVLSPRVLHLRIKYRCDYSICVENNVLSAIDWLVGKER